MAQHDKKIAKAQWFFTIWKINPKVSDCEQILIHINNAGVIETTGIRNGRKQ